MIAHPGIYPGLEADEYFADPCPEPSLSHSIARILLERSPMHAAAAHARLPGFVDQKSTAAMDDGSLLHGMILGAGKPIEIIHAEDYRTEAAKEARDEARELGCVPVLIEHHRDLRAAADAILDQMRQHPDLRAFFEPGASEVTIASQGGPMGAAIWCRGMIDRLPDDPGAPMFDLKTTGISAAPQAWERKLIHDYATQDAFYGDIVAALGERERQMLFVVVETAPPWGISVMAAAESLRAIARARMARARALWAQCLSVGKWPSYPLMTAYVEAPAWMLTTEADDVIQRQSLGTSTAADDTYLEEMLAP